jgi:hypothetical protein
MNFNMIIPGLKNIVVKNIVELGEFCPDYCGNRTENSSMP